MKIATRIQYEIEKHVGEPTEIILGSWMFEEFLKERETEELQNFRGLEKLEYLGIKVTKSDILKPNDINIYRKDIFGINNFFHAYHDMGGAFASFAHSLSRYTVLAIVTARYANDNDFDKNYVLLSEVPKKFYKPFIKMIKSGFDIKSAINTLDEVYNFKNV